MNRVHVSTGKPYDVFIGSGILSRAGETARLAGKRYAAAAVITDSTVDGLYGETVRQSLSKEGFRVCSYAFPPGEGSKTIETAQSILSFLAENGITRTDLVVALGGGVVGDVAGFCAAIYQRGTDYLQIPTTLLAAVDSSVGGKTAVNIPQGKNLVGSFWQPVAVLCDVDTLSTLEEEVFADGVAETIKYGCIWDRELFEQLERGELRPHLTDIIARCVRIKAEVVAQDERDTALRQILNFGHTIGHAVEKLSGFTTSHGKAVAIGMALMAAAGEGNGITSPGTADRIRAILKQYGLPDSCGYGLADLSAQCMGDKKRSGGTISLIVLEEMGRCRIHPVEAGDLLSFLERGSGR